MNKQNFNYQPMKNPIGTLLQFAPGASPPSWAMHCEGQTLKREDYPELYEILKHTYGGKDNEFQLPDYRETDLKDVVIKVSE
jgi:microcystin-dependent protein